MCKVAGAAAGTEVEVDRSATHPHDTSHSLDMDNIIAMDNMHDGPLLDLVNYKDIMYTNTHMRSSSLKPSQ